MPMDADAKTRLLEKMLGTGGGRALVAEATTASIRDQAGMSLDRRFHRLRAAWQHDCQLSSSPDQIAAHPAYRAIVAMGKPAVPLILEELRHRPDQWFRALSEITGENPVPHEHAGRVALMAADWIAWGQKKIAQNSSG